MLGPIDKFSLKGLDSIHLAPDNGPKINNNGSSDGIHEKPIKYSPRPGDQVPAINNVLNGFKTHDRGQLILPCGAGKTLTSLWIKEGMKAKKSLVLVPSISLIKQTKDAWEEQKTDDFDYLCVCSDPKVNKFNEEDENLENLDKETLRELRKEARAKVTTSPKAIKKFIESDDKDQVIYATYQSAPKIIEAIKDTDFEFDITFADEAHKTTGKLGKNAEENSLFTLMHDDANIPSKKRLYMTATPKVHTGTAGEYADMSNEEIYGPEFHRMSFAEAIELGILTDYQIVAVGVNEDEVKTQLGKAADQLDETELREVMNNIALEKVMKKYRASHALTFHSSIKKANEFRLQHQAFFPDTNAYHISGKDNVDKRKKIMDEFAANPFDQRSVISNARCLTEGVDVPAIDMVYFSDPKYSIVDIVQGSGRAFRKDKRKPDKTGFVVVPVLTKKGQSATEAAYTGRFNHLVRVVAALSDHDERLFDQINTGSSTSKRKKPGEEAKPKLVLEGFDDAVIDEFKDEVIAESRERLLGTKFENLEELRTFLFQESPKRPSNLAIFFNGRFDGRPRDIEILAKKEGLLAKEARPTVSQLADFIWGESSKLELEELNKCVELIKQRRPSRPDDLNTFFANGKNLNEILQTNHKYPARYLLDLFLAAMLKDELPIRDRKAALYIDLADYIWGHQYQGQNFDQIKTAIVEKHDEPANKGLEKFFSERLQSIGLNSLAKSAIAAGKIKKAAVKSLKAIKDLLWPPRKKLDFGLIKAKALGLSKTRPDNEHEFFAKNFNDAIPEIGEILSREANTPSLTLCRNAPVIADYIWGPKYTDLKEAILANKRPHARVSLDNLYNLIEDLLPHYPRNQSSQRGIYPRLIAAEPSAVDLIRKIKADSPERPEDFENYFRSSSFCCDLDEVFEIIGPIINRNTVGRPYRYLELKNLADFLWGTKYKSLADVQEALVPYRPSLESDPEGFVANEMKDTIGITTLELVPLLPRSYQNDLDAQRCTLAEILLGDYVSGRDTSERLTAKNLELSAKRRRYAKIAPESPTVQPEQEETVKDETKFDRLKREFLKKHPNKPAAANLTGYLTTKNAFMEWMALGKEAKEQRLIPSSADMNTSNLRLLEILYDR